MLVKLSGSIVRCVYQTTFQQDQLYRLQDMSSRILLLVAAILRTSIEIEIGVRYQPCEYEHLHECDQGLWLASMLITKILTWEYIVVSFRYLTKE